VQEQNFSAQENQKQKQLLTHRIFYLNKSDKMKNEKNKQTEKDLPGYPSYPESEDIYSKFKEEPEVNPDDPSQMKEPNADPNKPNEKDFKDDVSGGDLDVPGSELDDDKENIGAEDEENNYYSGADDNNEQ